MRGTGLERDGVYNLVTQVLVLSESKRFDRDCKPRPACSYQAAIGVMFGQPF